MGFIAALGAAALIWALLTGQAYSWGGQVTRDGQPVRYWLSVALYAGFAWLFAMLGPVR